MPKDEKQLSKPDDAIEWWADVYSKQPLIRALFAAATALPIPLGAGLAAIGKELMDAGVQSMLRERSREFFDELSTGERLLTKELIQQEDFLHSFFATWRVAMRTRNRQKIRCFARLLLSGIRKNELGGDTFDEFLGILNEISMRELEILRILKEYEDAYPHQIKNGELENDLQRAYHFWAEFEAVIGEKCGVRFETISSVLTRLSRTGFYELLGGLYVDGKAGEGHTTPLFVEFSKWLETEVEKQEK